MENFNNNNNNEENEIKRRNSKGQGSLYYEKNRDYWRATITTPDGKRKDFCDKKKSEAIRKRNEFIANKYISIPKLTLIDCCKKFIDNKVNSQAINPNTYETHLNTLKRVAKADIAKIPINQITIQDINDFLISESHYSSSVRRKRQENG